MIAKKSISITTQGAIPLGKQGEGGVLEILFPQPAQLMSETWTLNHRRATDRGAYPVPLEKRGSDLVWQVTTGDTGIPGRGEAELTCYGVDGQVLKSRTYNTNVVKSVTTGGEVPDPVKPWYDDIMQRLDQGGGGSGTPGEDGGYYTPTISQADTGTMIVAFTASGADMPAVEPVTVELPQGPAGKDGSPGADGRPGKDGADGAPGKDGVTPTIGANGNWYIGDTDTGKPSRGETGATGATGAKGDKGDKGDTGAQGIQGIQGEKGEKGDTGAQGAKGDKGDPGAKGDKGDKGDTGSPGVASFVYYNGSGLYLDPDATEPCDIDIMDEYMRMGTVYVESEGSMSAVLGVNTQNGTVFVLHPVNGTVMQIVLG